MESNRDIFLLFLGRSGFVRRFASKFSQAVENRAEIINLIEAGGNPFGGADTRETLKTGLALFATGAGLRDPLPIAK